MLTAIGTVYDREFGMLRLMLASPAGVPAVLTGRAVAAAPVGVLQGGIVLACAPLLVPLSPASSPPRPACWCSARRRERPARPARGGATAIGGKLRGRDQRGAVSAALRERRALPDGGMPAALRLLARVNPVTYQVDLMRHAFGQPTEFVGTDVLVLARPPWWRSA